jgi:hypothetical protein
VSLGKLSFTSRLVALLACALSFGRTTVSLTQLSTFHVRGIIRYYNGSPASAADVVFEGEGVAKTAQTDDKGYYETELPLGSFTMTARKVLRPSLIFVYKRPLFRVPSAANVSLNATFPSGSSCDLVTADGHMPTEEDARNACGGTDLFSVPSENNDPFQLSIQYGTRRPIGRKFEYGVIKALNIRILVAYNLFTLQADHVAYDEENRILEASGDAVVERADGTTQNADLMRFKINDGQVTPIP